MSFIEFERKNSKDKSKKIQNKSLNKGNIYICKKCFEIPLIQFNNINGEIIINTKCKCGIMDNNILDFENKFMLHEITKQYLSNILNSFFYCFNCNNYLCDSCINKHDTINKKKHIVINLKLTDKNSKEHKIYEKEKNNTLYCLNCNKRICKNCKDYHINEKHNMIKGNNNCMYNNNSFNLNNFLNDIQKLRNNFSTQKENISLQIKKIKNMINDIEKELSIINSKNKSFINIIENIYKSYIFYKDNYNYNIFTNFENLFSLCSNIDYDIKKITHEKIMKQCKEFISQIKKNNIISKKDDFNDISNISILTSMRESISSLNKTIENLNNISNSKIINNKRTKFIKLDKGKLRQGSYDKKTTTHLNGIKYELDFEKNINNNNSKNINENVYQQTIEKINNLMIKQKMLEKEKKKNFSLSPSKNNYYKPKLNINDTSIIKKIKQSQEKKHNNSFLTRSQSPVIKDNFLYENKKFPVKTLDKYFKVISKRKNAGSPFSKIYYNIKTDESTRASGGSKDFNLNYSIISNTTQCTEKYVNRKKDKYFEGFKINQKKKN